MTITRETLELAALAAGHEVVRTEAEMHGCDEVSTIYTGVMLRGVQDAWRPHTDITDAARLAVQLGFAVKSSTNQPFVHAWSFGEEFHTRSIHDGTELDKQRAYCEAVTLCAAAIGREMREGQR